MAGRQWRDFGEAREFARSLGLLDQAEWFVYSRGDLARRFGVRPQDIPACPWIIYRELGWSGIRDWLGPAPLAPAEPGYMEFRRARTFARSLRFAAAVQWRVWCRGDVRGKPARPANVPEDPARMYPRAWRGWPDWLGTVGSRHRPSGRFLPFEQVRLYVHGLGLDNVKQWRAWCKLHRPPNIPANPDIAYRHRGWRGYGDWLGTDATASLLTPTIPYEEARALAQRLGLTGEPDFHAWTRGQRTDLPPAPVGFPATPHRAYSGRGWTGWGDFLGTGNVAPADRKFPPFEELREHAHGLGLANHHEWSAYCRGAGALPPSPDLDLPCNPDSAYRDRGWTSWGDFLGTGFVASTRREYRPFGGARAFARALRLGSVYEWRAFVRGEFAGLPPLPPDIPAAPDGHYDTRGWLGWPDFLGRPGGKRVLRSFADARRAARKLGFRRGRDWADWLHGERPDLPEPPPDLPVAPDRAYRGKGWKSWGDFLGTRHVAPANRKFRPFEKARAFARTLGLGSRAEWTAWGRGSPMRGPRRADVPAKPHIVYAGKGWAGWPDFLGTDTD